MKTHGLMKGVSSLARILVITTGLCTVSVTSFLVGFTLAESISGRYESLEAKVGELEVKVTGRNTMEVLMKLAQMSNSMERYSLKEL